MEVIDPGHLQITIEHFIDESYTDSSRAPKELGNQELPVGTPLGSQCLSKPTTSSGHSLGLPVSLEIGKLSHGHSQEGFTKNFHFLKTKF